MPDDVTLTDLEVIQQFSLAVRGASAPRDAVIRALEADLAHLTGGRRAARPAASSTEKAAPPAAKAAPRKTSAAPAKRAPAKKAARRA